jgi:hypothetical protein
MFLDQSGTISPEEFKEFCGEYLEIGITDYIEDEVWIKLKKKKDEELYFGGEFVSCFSFFRILQGT